MIKAVIFDMDGVIFDSECKVIETWKVVADKYGIKDIESFCLSAMGQNREAAKARFLEIYGADAPYDAYKAEMSDLFHERYNKGRLPLKPYVKESLTSLKERGYLLAVATSTREEVVTAELGDAGLIKFFDAIICGDMVSKSKPDPEIYLKACETLGVKPKDAIGVEDSHNGIRAVKAAGMTAVMIPDLMPVTEEMKEKADFILEDMGKLVSYCKIKK